MRRPWLGLGDPRITTLIEIRGIFKLISDILAIWGT